MGKGVLTLVPNIVNDRTPMTTYGGASHATH
jgi:hypothetical protein